jgi:hypothetical protein
MSTNNKIKSTRKRQNRSQRRRKNGSAYTIRRGGFLTPFRNRVKQRFTAFRQRRADAATARARESQARIDGNVSPRFRTSPGRWFRTRFRRNRSNTANPIPVNPVNPINPSIYTHVQPDPDVIRHYSRIFSEESTASKSEKDKAIDDLKHYLDAVNSNSSGEIERTMAEVDGIADESNAAVNAMHDMLSRRGPQVSNDELEAYMAELSSPQNSHRIPHPPPPPSTSHSPGQFVRRRPGSKK